MSDLPSNMMNHSGRMLTIASIVALAFPVQQIIRHPFDVDRFLHKDARAAWDDFQKQRMNEALVAAYLHDPHYTIGKITIPFTEAMKAACTQKPTHAIDGCRPLSTNATTPIQQASYFPLPEEAAATLTTLANDSPFPITSLPQATARAVIYRVKLQPILPIPLQTKNLTQLDY